MNNRYREEEQENSMNQEESVVELNEEIKIEENDELKKAQEEIKRLNDLYLRTLADADNFKRRINEERIRERKYASQSLLEKFVNALDVFDRVVSIKTDDDKLKSFLQGFEMINQQLKQILNDEGVKRIDSLYQPFNPTYQHAVEVGNNEKYEDDIVIGELQSGYMYKDRVLRPALVVVNKKNKKENKE
ncbi:MAG: nucleotide exchange factor GrpE [Bacilli bacterium]|nr:nucleotide exchange factor GrpE [Bacilli bacterium]